MDGEEARKITLIYDAAAKGNIAKFEELLTQSKYTLDGVSFSCPNRTPLHVATLHGNLGMVEEMVSKNPQLAKVVDSGRSSPLHIAAAEGHTEIANKLSSVASQMCWWRDCQGMNPIHIAAINGHVAILKDLILLHPLAAREKVGSGQTALHLCVKHGQVPALEVLVDKYKGLVYAEDDDGDTILHLAARYNQLEAIKYLVVRKKMSKRSRNSKGETALEILSKSPRDASCAEIRKILIKGTTLSSLLLDGPEVFFMKMSDVVMVVVVLIATMAFQAAFNPPGGFDGAGEAMMASAHPMIYKSFIFANTLAFASSLFTIFLLTTRLPSAYSIFMTVVMYTMWLSLTSIAVSYGAAVIVTSPTPSHEKTQSLGLVIKAVVFVSLWILAIFYLGLYLVFLCMRKKRRNSDNTATPPLMTTAARSPSPPLMTTAARSPSPPPSP